jgi:hypothetical protein
MYPPKQAKELMSENGTETPNAPHQKEVKISHTTGHITEGCWIINISQWFGVNIKDNCHNVLCCCTAMPVPVQLPTLLKSSRNYTFKS